MCPAVKSGTPSCSDWRRQTRRQSYTCSNEHERNDELPESTVSTQVASPQCPSDHSDASKTCNGFRDSATEKSASLPPRKETLGIRDSARRRTFTLADFAQYEPPKKTQKQIKRKKLESRKEPMPVDKGCWKCRRCTLENEAHFSRCAACDFSVKEATMFPSL